jgi:hypothetical protein
LDSFDYLRHNCGVLNNPMPDIVTYFQMIQITAANAAVGPVDLKTYFNR